MPFVIGFESESGAYAYPVSILNFRDIVNDIDDVVPIVVTFCPLYGSGVVFSRELNGPTLIFGNISAVYQSGLIMFDHQTGSYWVQVSGEAVVGTPTDQRLKALPAVTVEWNRWREFHPDTMALTKGSREDAVFSAAYARNPQIRIEGPLNVDILVFPVDRDRLNRCLLSGKVVIIAEVDSDIKAYPPWPSSATEPSWMPWAASPWSSSPKTLAKAPPPSSPPSGIGR
jgi:hypothetical protein